MTLQQVFDRVALHLLRQNERSSVRYQHAEYRCMYRGPNGLKCAVGFLIADKYYREVLEGRTASHSSVIEALEASGIPVRTLPVFRHLLLHLQGVHDTCDPASWKDKLEAAAHKFGLTMPALANEMLPATEDSDEPAPAARQVASAL